MMDYGMNMTEPNTCHLEPCGLTHRQKKILLEQELLESKDISRFKPEVIGPLLSEIFTDAWLRLTKKGGALHHILTWPHMQFFLTKGCSGQVKLNQWTQDLLTKVVLQIDQTLRELDNGDITYDELKTLTENQTSFLSLINTSELFSNGIPNHHALETTLKERLTQLQEFDDMIGDINLFIDSTAKAYPSGGATELRLRISQDKSLIKPIKYVTGKEGKIYQVFKDLQGSGLFKHHFDSLCKLTNQTQKLDLTSVVTGVLLPSMTSFKILQQGLTDSSVRLGEMDGSIGSLINKEMTMVCSDWILEREMQLHQARMLSVHKQFVSVVMDLQRAYRTQYPGSFGILETFEKKEMDMELACIDEEAASVITKLSYLTPGRLDYMKAFIDAKPLIALLQEAFTSAEEVEDLLTKRLESKVANDLVKMVQVFSPVIFNIPQEADVHDLLNGFSKVFKVCNKDIIGYLKEFTKDLGYLKLAISPKHTDERTEKKTIDRLPKGEEIEDLIRKKGPDLLKKMTLDAMFALQLLSTGVCTISWYQDFVAKPFTNEQKAEVLNLIRVGTVEQYQGFLEALKATGQESVIQELNDYTPAVE